MTTQDDSLKNLFETAHYSDDLVDFTMIADENDPDDDDDFEAKLSLPIQLALLSDDEFDSLLDQKLRDRNENRT